MNDRDCPFCNLIANNHLGYLPRVVSFEPLDPVTPGHRLFVPSWHTEHPNAGDLGEAMEAAEAWGGEGDEDYNLITSSGALATQTIDHIHVHYVPRREGDGLVLPWTNQKRRSHE